MATTSIDPTLLAGAPPSKTTSRGFSDLKSEDFFGLLIAQLQNQDPLKPTDNQQLLQQMSMIRQMEQTTTMNKSLDALAHEQRFGATAGLIGQYVWGTVQDSAGKDVDVSGLVVGVRFDKDGNALLDLHNGKSLPASKVDEVTVVDNLPKDVRDRLATELQQMQNGNGGLESNGSTAGNGSSTTNGSTPTTGTSGGNGTSGTARVKASDAKLSALLERLQAGNDRAANTWASFFDKGLGIQG